VTFKDNEVTGNSGSGGSFNYVYGAVEATGNVLRDNTGTGLRFNKRDAGAITIKENEVTGGHGNESGITLYHNGGGNAQVSANTVSGGHGYGIRVENGSQYVKPQIKDNVIRENGRAGIRTTGKVLPEVSGNTLDGNGNGPE
jgi:hypothetical protein